MRIHTLHREQLIPNSIAEVFQFFANAENLEALTPPRVKFRILTPQPISVHQGTLIRYQLRVHGIPIRWTTEIVRWNPPHEFVDVQLKGPYRLWEHTHRFISEGDQTRMADTVRYAMPFGPLGSIAHLLTVKADLKIIFDYRATAVVRLLGDRVARP